MAVNNSLTPDVTEMDLDAFVSAGKITQQSNSSEVEAKGKTKSSKRAKTPIKKPKKIAKSKDPNYHKLTLYLPVDVIAQLKTAVASEANKDISDISAELYTAYISRTMKKILKKFN